LTEWPLFLRPDFPRMKELLKTPLIFDGRRQHAPAAMKSTESGGLRFEKSGPGERILLAREA